METGEPKKKRKRVVTKNELRRILISYKYSYECTHVVCKQEKRVLQSKLDKTREELRKNNDVLRSVTDKLLKTRTALIQMCDILKTRFPNTNLAARIRTWEERWSLQDKSGTWKIGLTQKEQSSLFCGKNKLLTKKVRSSSAKPAVENAVLHAPHQNNSFHEFARQTVTPISCKTDKVTRQRPSSSHTPGTSQLNVTVQGPVPAKPAVENGVLRAPHQNNAFHEFARQTVTPISRKTDKVARQRPSSILSPGASQLNVTVQDPVQSLTATAFVSCGVDLTSTFLSTNGSEKDTKQNIVGGVQNKAVLEEQKKPEKLLGGSDTDGDIICISDEEPETTCIK